MRLTLEIPDELAARAWSVAQSHGSTLEEFTVTALRDEVQRRESEETSSFHFSTVAGNGLAGKLSPSQAIERAYGLDVEVRTTRS
jgi:hypothetical protein